MFTISCPPKVIWLGRKGENEFRTIEVEVSEWLRDYPNGTVSVVYHRPDGAIYLPTVTTSGNVTSWLVTATDTAIAGKGEVEYRLADGDIIGKSVKMPTMVSAAINATTDAPAPPPEDWTATAADLQRQIGDLDDLETEDKSSLVAAINEAAQSGGGGIPEAPIDGKQYARQNGEWTEVQSASGQGWTDEQIDLLEAVFEKLVYTDAEGGAIAAQLINSLRGGVVPEEPITIAFDGAKAVISGLGNTTITYSGATAKIGYMPL